MKRFLITVLCLLMLVIPTSGCKSTEPSLYTVTFYDVFDTVTVLRGYASDRSEFDQVAGRIHTLLLEYHSLYDIYHDPEKGNNLKTVNDNAGSEPVSVDSRIIDLLLFCKKTDTFTGHKVNAMLGPVLSIWHDARTLALEEPSQAYLPSFDVLSDAAKHVDFSLLEIDESALTVRIINSDASLDVGAIAKGFTVQRALEYLPDGYLLSLGGNIAVKGNKPDGSVWNVGIQDPFDPSSISLVVTVSNVSVVTSGDYQRTFSFNGKEYHHIIDPVTLYPSEYWKSVTVICSDSAVGDALSTALFLMDQEEGIRLLEQFDADAMWVSFDGTRYYTDGFSSLIKNS